METVLINVKNKSDKRLLLSLAEKLGMPARTLTALEVEDWHLAQKIDVGMKTSDVSREEVLKVLSK